MEFNVKQAVLGDHSRTNRSLRIITTSLLLMLVVFLRRHGSEGYFVKTVSNVESCFLRGIQRESTVFFSLDGFVSETLLLVCAACSPLTLATESFSLLFVAGRSSLPCFALKDEINPAHCSPGLLQWGWASRYFQEISN